MMRYGSSGPGGGSIPEFMMRTGVIAPFNPYDVRHDITERNVEREVRVPVGYPPGVAQYGPPEGSAVSPLPEGAVISIVGVFAGTDSFGRAVTKFDLPAAPESGAAMETGRRLKRLARTMRAQGGALQLPADVVGGPLSALARGEAVVLRFANGVTVSVAP